MSPPRPVRGRRRGPAVVAGVLGTALVISGCGGASPTTGGSTSDDRGGVEVVATTAVLGDVVRTVVGDQGAVSVLMDAGQDPHTFQLSARQVAELGHVDLLVVNGLGLEAGLADAIAQATADGIPVLDVGASLDPVPAGPGEHDEHGHDQPAGDEQTDDEHAANEPGPSEQSDEHRAEEHGGDAARDDDHEHGTDDPHVWLDVDRMTAAPGLVADALDDMAEGDWHPRADALAGQLENLDADVAATVAAIPDACRQVATGHDELGYFARRYGLSVPVTVIPGTSTDADPSARDFAAGIDTVRASDVPAVVVDEAASSRLAEAFADDAGVTVVALPLAGPSQSGPGSQGYVGMMHAIADGLAEALATCPAATDK